MTVFCSSVWAGILVIRSASAAAAARAGSAIASVKAPFIAGSRSKSDSSLLEIFLAKVSSKPDCSRDWCLTPLGFLVASGLLAVGTIGEPGTTPPLLNLVVGSF